VLSGPAPGSATNNNAPLISGTAGTTQGDLPGVTVQIYAGATATGTPVQTLSTTAGTGGAFAVTATALADGTYTAVATQSDSAGNTGTSTPNTFVIDTTPPAVALTNPSSGTTTSATPTFAGTAGTAVGDLSSVTVLIFAGTSATGTPVETLSATANALGAFQVIASLAIADGTYTAVAEQSDRGGNLGISAAITFIVHTA
jgi:hypothetical protein